MPIETATKAAVIKPRQTLGSPLTLQVVNRDYKLERLDDLQRPRPGHGDLTGAIK
ncbi:MAG: chorismate synthase, partial [Burkholderiales bacterium]